MKKFDPDKNINNTFFQGQYKDIWRLSNPEALTTAEIKFLVEEFNLTQSTSVLDLMCGYGRHSIGLAEKGIPVTAVDNLPEYISEIDQTAAERNLPIHCHLRNVLEFIPPRDENYDLIICMGNSISFFNEEEISVMLKNISQNLKAGSKLVINSLMLAEIAFNQFRSKTWSYVEDLRYLSDVKYEYFPPRFETETYIISPDGSTEFKKSVDYIYTIAEMQRILSNCDFTIRKVYSIPGKKLFRIGEPRAYIVAEWAF